MSSNYDPTPSWGHGAQIVALNYQRPDMAVRSEAKRTAALPSRTTK